MEEKAIVFQQDTVVACIMIAIMAIGVVLWGIRQFNIYRKHKSEVKKVIDRRETAKRYFNAYATQSTAEDSLRKIHSSMR